MHYRLILFFLFCFSKQYGQFEFKGDVNEEYSNATAYLHLIDDFNKSGLFLIEQIILESKIDSLGQFIFKGDFLSEDNQVYKIYLDNCNDDISNYKHLLNKCDENLSVIFIANNKDKIHFPLNDLSQMFCSFQFTRKQNISIYKIDSVQENLLSDLHSSKSDAQRKMVYKNYFIELQKYSQTLNEPLAELYTYHLYSDDESFSREFYIGDLKKSKYYNNLLKKLELAYPESTYSNNYKEELIKDQYPLLKSKYNTFRYLAYGLAFLLFVSFLVNYFLIRKTNLFGKKAIVQDYKTLLSPQEQKVFELIYEKLSNKEIAEKLFISISTVKTHINNIYSKLSISSRNEISTFFS